jgi:hypothetical protein
MWLVSAAGYSGVNMRHSITGRLNTKFISFEVITENNGVRTGKKEHI